MNNLSEKDLKYFVTNWRNACMLDLSDVEPNVTPNLSEDEPITAYDGAYKLEHVGSPHHSQSDYRFTGPNFVLILTGEERSLGSGRAILTSPSRFVGEVSVEKGELFSSIQDMNHCFRVLMACYKTYCRSDNQQTQYKDPKFRNQITIGMMQGVKRVLDPKVHHQIPEGLWRASV